LGGTWWVLGGLHGGLHIIVEQFQVSF
jgi:hypothetical protein